ncbi:hypothetical protein HHK36_025071 [Tetracentron sinense]|uniref:Uncharacterized protein n=1 Tax=Tetracentron sinense TaxID=13715 RepID=A0A835D838_TETSI|nr:hypothetical protein HHK36_025071 [Tetracentron sinense]
MAMPPGLYRLCWGNANPLRYSSESHPSRSIFEDMVQSTSVESARRLVGMCSASSELTLVVPFRLVIHSITSRCTIMSYSVICFAGLFMLTTNAYEVMMDQLKASSLEQLHGSKLMKGYCMNAIISHSNCNALCFSIDGQTIFPGHVDGNLRLLEIQTGKLRSEVAAHTHGNLRIDE